MAKRIAEIVMPQLAESLVSATIDRWLKEPGETVDLYEPICEVITDKVNAELPSTVHGVLVKILAGPGETVDVGAPICLVETEASAGAEPAAGPAGGEEAVSVPAPAPQPPERAAAATDAPDPAAPMRGRYSPAVQRLAAEHRVDLRGVAGTGWGGRITRQDVLAHIAAGAAASASASPAPSGGASGAAVPAAQAQPPAPERPPAPTPQPAPVRPAEPAHLPAVEVEGQVAPGREYFIDVTPIRKTIASRMRQSVNEIPHAWTVIEVDLTNLTQLRNKWKEEFRKQEGINLTYMPFVLKAVVSAIKDYPIMNSVWAGDRIIVKRDINLSLAVGTDHSVLTPVIRNADQKNIAGLAREIHELARKTREGKLKLSDMQDGTFTVNNTGTFGSIMSYPIINYPQAAIMTFEAVVRRPVVIGDMIGIRSMVNLCLSFDHRILDGVICGQFHQRVKECLESYTLDTSLY